jgi:hypothetical protein
LRSPIAEILETALALQRAPGERFRLRERPLPEGIVHVLEIASGAPQALRDAATDLGQEEQDLLEASRFYLEQVLFAAPDADAYRVLGLASDAAQDTIRVHHRWLQRWLHPDRARAGDSTVFATRVNQAWSQLRTPELRHAYDVRLAEARLAGASAPLPAATIQRWQQDEMEDPAMGRRSRWLLAAALLSCAVLAVLILRHQETVEPWHQPDEGASAIVPALDDRDFGILTEALATAPPTPAAAIPPAITPTSDQIPNPPAFVPAPDRTHTPAPVPARAPAPCRAEPCSAALAPATPPPPPAKAERGSALQPTRRRASAPVPTQPIKNVVATVSSVPAGSEPAVAPKAAEHGSALQQGQVDPEVMLQRMQQAEHRLAQVVAYLANRPGAAPMWNDPSIEAEAKRARTELNPRKGSKMELDKTAWRLQRDSASVSADYRCRTAGGGVGAGRLDVQLIWREGLWLVRSVDLVPAA